MKTLAISALGALMALSCYAAPTVPPTLYVTDGTNSVLLDSTGTCVVLTGTATCVASVTPGDLSLAGTMLGSDASLTGATCKTPPAYPGSDLILSAKGTTMITARCSATGYSTVGTATLTGGSTGTTFTGYVDANNVVCTTGPCAGQAIGPVPAGGSVTGAIVTSPYALTTEVTLNLGASFPATVRGDFNINVTAVTPTGCPASPGFWKHHNYPTTLIFPVIVGGHSYSAADFNSIVTSPGGGNAVDILGFQLVAALLNIAAGGQTNSTVLGDIAQAQLYLEANQGLAGFTGTYPIVMPTSSVKPSSPLGVAMTNIASVLDGYNNGFFHSCNDGDGLNIPGGK